MDYPLVGYSKGGQHIQSCFLYAKLVNWLLEPDEPSCSNAYHGGSYKRDAIQTSTPFSSIRL